MHEDTGGMMKPYRWGGRFYNSKHDSTLRRLRNFARSFCCVMGHQLRQLVRKSKTRDLACSGSWFVPLLNPADRSSEPLITWLGHSTFLIQVARLNIITDPIFFGGFPLFTRQLPLPIALKNLPKIDVVVISHNHKDHMDGRSLRALKVHDPLFLVPLGDKRWLLGRGFRKVIEKSWWEIEVLGAPDVQVSLSFLPAVHWASRNLLDINRSLWGSWMIEVAGYKIYFAGDTAYGGHFTTISQRYSPIDIAMMPIGPNEPRRYISDAHVSSEEAVKAFIELGARHFVPMHWGTFARMGAERHDDPLKQLGAVWERYRQMLTNAVLHVVRCGDPIHIR